MTAIHSGSGAYVVLVATGAVVGMVDTDSVTEGWAVIGKVVTFPCWSVGAGVNTGGGRNMTLADEVVFPLEPLTPADVYESCM